MSKVVKEKKKVMKKNTYETLKALYYSGKVKPSLNKILVELENDSKNLELSLLACQCLLRTKNFDDLSSHADVSINLAPKTAGGYYYKGMAFQYTKGKEQEALKNFNEALTLDPDNTIYLKSKATTHLLLYTDYDLPIKFAEKHRVKAEEILSKIVELIEQKGNPDYIDFLTIGDVSIMISQPLDAKKYFIKAVNTFNTSDTSKQDMNIYKDIIKAQKACIKLMAKFTE
ncbi:MAG: tetratricopeptide (TPR) repeat protein [Cyclobacteriaceae bacterium]|jgi:tetratricopeptide (TPR) repeat protein